MSLQYYLVALGDLLVRVESLENSCVGLAKLDELRNEMKELLEAVITKNDLFQAHNAALDVDI